MEDILAKDEESGEEEKRYTMIFDHSALEKNIEFIFVSDFSTLFTASPHKYGI